MKTASTTTPARLQVRGDDDQDDEGRDDQHDVGDHVQDLVHACPPR